MQAKGIDVGTHYPAVHLFSFYRRHYGYREGMFPEAERIASRIITLPIYPSLSATDQEKIINSLISLLESA
jgi:dTDP-4-amino-4,6-dideoxygalactose transaminase